MANFGNRIIRAARAYQGRMNFPKKSTKKAIGANVRFFEGQEQLIPVLRRLAGV